jgi:putative oxidoreductase
MAAFMRPFESQAYAAFRIVVGLLVPLARQPEAVRLPRADAGRSPAFIIYIAGRSSSFGGVLVMIGLFTSWAAFICSG